MPEEPTLQPVVLFTVEGVSIDDPVLRAREGRPALGTELRAIGASDEPLTALASVMTGLPPWQHGLQGAHGDLTRATETLGEALGSLGYRSLAFLDRSPRLHDAGFAQGIDEVHPLRAGKRAAAALRALDAGDFVWVHLRLHPNDGGRARVRRRLDELLAAARSGRAWRTASVAVVGIPPVPGRRAHPTVLGRRLLEVPVWIGGLEGLEPTSIRAPVETSRVFATLVEAAGGRPSPATAPTLRGPPVDRPLVSVAYGAERPSEPGVLHTVYSLVEQDLQLLWWADLGPEKRLAPPLTGLGPIRLGLRRWEGDTMRPARDPEASRAMAARLHDAWLTFQDREEAPSWRPLPELPDGGAG